MDTKLLQLIPEYRDDVWGGQRLRSGTLAAEASVVHQTGLPKAGHSFLNSATWCGAA